MFKVVAVACALACLAIVGVKLTLYPPFGGVSIVATTTLALLGALSLASERWYARDPLVVRKLWALIVSTTLTFALFDLAAGALLITRLSPPTVPDAIAHHTLQPSTKSRFDGTEFDYVQSVNSDGLRGPEVPPIAAEGRGDAYRVLMLGDSFTMGKGVADDDTFCAQLQRRLSAEATSRPVQILNAGVDSYTPLLSHLRLLQLIDKLKPDLVIENFDIRDLLQEQAYRAAATRDDKGTVMAVDGRADPSSDVALPRALRDWVHNHLFFTRLLVFYLTDRSEMSIDNLVSFADPRLLVHTLATDTEDRRAQWNDVFDSLVRTKALCDQHGAQFVLTTYPWGHQVGPHEWSVGRTSFVPDGIPTSNRSQLTMQALARKHGIELVDLFDVFRKPSPTPLYYAFDMHWTKAGHTRMAQTLEPLIRARSGNEPLVDATKPQREER